MNNYHFIFHGIWCILVGQLSWKNHILAQLRVSKTKQEKKLKPKDLKKILVRLFKILMFWNQGRDRNRRKMKSGDQKGTFFVIFKVNINPNLLFSGMQSKKKRTNTYETWDISKIKSQNLYNSLENCYRNINDHWLNS